MFPAASSFDSMSTRLRRRRKATLLSAPRWCCSNRWHELQGLYMRLRRSPCVLDWWLCTARPLYHYLSMMNLGWNGSLGSLVSSPKTKWIRVHMRTSPLSTHPIVEMHLASVMSATESLRDKNPTKLHPKPQFHSQVCSSSPFPMSFPHILDVWLYERLW